MRPILDWRVDRACLPRGLNRQLSHIDGCAAAFSDPPDPRPASGKALAQNTGPWHRALRIVVSSSAQRLKPHAIDVRISIDPIHWFLHGKEDVRSSYYLEDVATEFQVQGLELDWTCVVWDGDLRLGRDGWEYFDFAGDRWRNVRAEERRRYLLNAYRVLLTRARQGMVIVVPEGGKEDPTRSPGFYDPAFSMLQAAGIPNL